MANYAVDSLQDGCYPGTVVLINILGIQNQSDLDAVEGTIVPAKAALWEEKPLAGSCYALLLNTDGLQKGACKWMNVHISYGIIYAKIPLP